MSDPDQTPATERRWLGSSLAGRIYVCAGLPIALFMAFSVYLWWSLNGVADSLRRDVTDLTTLSLQAKDMQAHVIQVQQFLTDVSATRAQDGLDDGFKQAQEHKDVFLQGLAAFEKAQQAGQVKLPEQALSSLRTRFEAYYASGVSMAQAYVHGGPAEGNPMMGHFDKTSTALQDEIAPFVTQQVMSLNAAIEETIHRVALLQVACAVVCALAIAAVGIACLRLARSIVRPLAQLVEAVRRFAAGDLTTAIRGGGYDEIGTLTSELATMQAQWNSTLAMVKDCAAAIDQASAEVASGSQDLSQRTESAAANLQQTASSVEVLNGTVRMSADSASNANGLAGAASQVAREGGYVVTQVVSTMEEINASSRRIGDIIGVIDGIAFQTNILALNAAVEAARAGEQGRGFAVVASEVRSLAQRSAQAAREIKQLVGASVEKVEVGTRLVSEAGGTMTEIVASVQRVSDIIGEISAASADQSDGISQVHSAVGHLDQMTQQNAALVEQSAAAAESLKAQARKLGALVAGFQLAGA
jgi:methyl-accepting chemotaxis protein